MHDTANPTPPSAQQIRRVLVAETIGDEGLALLRAANRVQVECGTGAPGELEALIESAHGLIVRSATRVTKELLARAPDLQVVVRAGTGFDNIDLEAATAAGVVVMNTPGGNTNAACEHTFALLLALARHVPAAHQSLREQRWDRKSFVGWELRGKTLGLIGLGRIGVEVAARAQAFKMQVIAYDPFLSRDAVGSKAAPLVSLDELLETSDVISLHLPLTGDTQGMIGAPQLARLRPGSFIVNCARGGLIDEQALLAALDSGHLGGAALDAFADEPTPPAELVQHPRVVATPHLGASTREAAASVGIQAARQVLGVLDATSFENAINMPIRDPDLLASLAPYLILSEKMGQLQAQILDGGVKQVELEVFGDIPDAGPLCLAYLRGLLAPIVGASVNYVNAPYIARERGIRVSESRAAVSPSEFATVVSVVVHTDNGQHVLRGTLMNDSAPHIVDIDGFRIDALPKGHLVLCRSKDLPGVIGAIGTEFGRHGLNISEFRLGRRAPGEDALSVITLDEAPSQEALAGLRQLPAVLSVRSVQL